MKAALTVFALILGLSFCVTKPKGIARSKAQRTETAARASDGTNQPAANVIGPKGESVPQTVEALLVTVIDSSPSVRNYWKTMQQAAKNIIAGAPGKASVAIVGIDAEAVKSDVFDPAHKRYAMNFVDSLTIGGHFTDLARGTDAALSVLQGANPTRCVLVYLTDGKLTVPKTFRDKSTFYDLVRREFTSRTNVTVLVVNVRGENSIANEPLPPNVKIFPLKSANELPDVIKQTLSPTINEKLTVAETSRSISPVGVVASSSHGYWFGGIAVVVLLVLAGFLIWHGRFRTKRFSEVAYESPENLLRQDDLEPDESTPEPAALITAESFDATTGRRSLPRRALIRVGERVTIGASSFVEMSLESLKQAQTLQVGFDGKTVRVDRLRPQSIGELDNVWLNQQSAPIQFALTEGDLLRLGDFSIKLTMTTDDVLPSSLLSRSQVPSSKRNLNSRRFAG